MILALLTYNQAVVLIGVSLLGAAAGVIGSYAVLARRSLTGDALAHAALPGVCLGFFVAGERRLDALLAGAAASALLGVALLGLLTRRTRLREDAALAIVLSVFYGLGVVLLSRIVLLHGNKAGLESFILGKTSDMLWTDAALIAGLAGATLLVVFSLHKELKLVVFDPAFARVQGWPAGTIDFLMRLLLVGAVIVGLPAVGVLLIAALLVIPPAAARFWTNRLDAMLLLAGLLGLLAGILGTILTSNVRRLSAGPSIILSASFLFLLSFLFAPRRGWLARWSLHRRQVRSMERFRLLLALHDLGADDGRPIEFARLADHLGLHGPRLLRFLRAADDLVEVRNDQVTVGEESLAAIGDAARRREHWRRQLVDFPEQAPALLRLDFPLAPEP